MYENPEDALYFGEVYRTILQEAWLPAGATVWQRTGISRRGRRPTQQGLYAQSPTSEQAIIRQYFAACTSAWNALPWLTPTDTFCDTRLGKEYWLKEKTDRGLLCSYYDLYMRTSLRYCFDTGCIPPTNYLLSVQAQLQEVKPSKAYDLTFPNACGPVSMISGLGEFIPPTEWLSPPCYRPDTLCFQDENGSQGSISYAFSPLLPCKVILTILADSTELHVNETIFLWVPPVQQDVPPFTFSISTNESGANLYPHEAAPSEKIFYQAGSQPGLDTIKVVDQDIGIGYLDIDITDWPVGPGFKCIGNIFYEYCTPLGRLSFEGAAPQWVQVGDIVYAPYDDRFAFAAFPVSLVTADYVFITTDLISVQRVDRVPSGASVYRQVEDG